MRPRQSKSILPRFHRAIEAQVYRQILRDFANRMRYGHRAPLSAMSVYPRPRDITQKYVRPPGGPRLGRQQSGMVKGGDWDTHRAELFSSTKFVSCRMRWVEGADWEETPIFHQMLAQIEQGQVPDECHSREEVLMRYHRLDQIFEETRARGRMLGMEELPDFHYRRSHGATLVHLARDGSCLRSGGGAHRFAMAHILDLPEMPAQLGVVHPDAIRDGHLERLRVSALGPKP